MRVLLNQGQVKVWEASRGETVEWLGHHTEPHCALIDSGNVDRAGPRGGKALLEQRVWAKDRSLGK